MNCCLQTLPDPDGGWSAVLSFCCGYHLYVAELYLGVDTEAQAADEAEQIVLAGEDDPRLHWIVVEEPLH